MPKVKETLSKLEAGARDDKANLLELAVDCAKNLATVGEISDAMERVYGRFAAKTQIVEGAYAEQFGDAERVKKLVARSQSFMETYGRRPRILVAKLGQDGHDRGAHVIASGLCRSRIRRGCWPLFFRRRKKWCARRWRQTCT